MKVDTLDIWGDSPPSAFIRKSTERWAMVLMRAGYLYLDLFSLSPLPRAETEILFLLFAEDSGSSEANLLARRLHMARQTMTTLLDKLERAGRVERLAHPTDRRRKLVHITSKGLEIVRKVGRQALHRDAELAARFPRAEVSASLDFVERYCDLAEQWNRDHPQ